MTRSLRLAVIFAMLFALVGALQIRGSSPARASAASYDSQVLADGPLVLYPFDENDSATTFQNIAHPGYNAVAVGGGHTEAGDSPFNNGSSDGSLIYNSGGATPGYAQAPQLFPMLGDNSRTVEFWFETPTGLPQCLVSAGVQAHGASMSICLTDGNQVYSPTPGQPGVYIQFFDADIYVPYVGLTNGNWQYLAVTLSGSSVSVDINGWTGDGFVWNGSTYSALTGQPFTLPLVPNTAATPVQIGGPQGWQPARFGAIDELAVYPSALSTSALYQHYVDAVAQPHIDLTPYPVQVIVGRSLSAAQVASFTYVPEPGGVVPPVTSFTASIDWGDGTSSPGTVAPAGLDPGGASFVVSASHTYTAPLTGSMNVTVFTSLASAVAYAPALVYPPTPSAAFIVNPSNPSQNGIALLMPQTPQLGQRPIKSYVWQFADTDALVVDNQQNDKLINATLQQLAANPGDGFLKAEGMALGILPKDANDVIDGWSSDQVLQMVKVWQDYFPQHIVPHAFDYFGTVGVRLTITDTGGGQSSYVQNPQVSPYCFAWGGQFSSWFGGYTTCDTINGFAVQFGPHRPSDYATFNISQDIPGISAGFGMTLTVVRPLQSGDHIQVYVGAQLTVGVGLGGSVSASLGWLGPPDPNDAPVSQADVDSFVNGVTISGGAAVQIANFGGGFTAVESPTSTYPAGERLAGQRMVGEETSLSLGTVTSHLLAFSAAATVGCSIPISLPLPALQPATTLFNDATSGTPSQAGNTSTALQTLVTALLGSGVNLPTAIAQAVVNCAGHSS